MRILIAEDDATSRMILEAIITHLGHDYLSAANGEEAWQLFQCSDIDVVISDRSMPGMDGLELCRRVRSRPYNNKYIYFIFVTSFGDSLRVLDGNAAGADDYLLKPVDTDQLATRLVVAERITQLHERLRTQQTQLELLNRRLFDQARMDELTGLYNRLKLREDLDLLSAEADGHPGPYCALMFDIDSFKAYNDTYGHHGGDKILTSVASVLLKNIRQGERGYRFGGEEFLLILEKATLQQGCVAAEFCRKAIQNLKIPHESSARNIVTISVGVAQWLQGDETVNSWLRKADDALYQAKNSGRNCVYPGIF